MQICHLKVMDVITGMRGWEIDKSEWEEDLGGGISQVLALGSGANSKSFFPLRGSVGLRRRKGEERH
jgi:hypothetical protein